MSVQLSLQNITLQTTKPKTSIEIVAICYKCGMEIKLKKPTEILSSPRNDGGEAVASAKTVDGGVAFVRWDPKARIWSIDKDLTLGDVLTMPPVPEKMFIDINLEKWIKEGAELADQLELTKLKIKHETYLKNKKEE